MNSCSKYPLHDETSKCRKDEDCGCGHPCPQGAIFEYSFSNFGPLDVTFVEGLSTQIFNQPIASVCVDTTCLDCARVIIDFIGILNVTTTVSATSTLTFTLYRIGNGFRTPQPVATFNYYVADITGGVTTSHTLAFRYPAPAGDCNGRCTYILELNSIYNLDFGTITYAINGTMSALVIDSSR
jgi:hypothetical protein